jgi:hypothetical protein
MSKKCGSVVGGKLHGMPKKRLEGSIMMDV